MIKNFIWHKIIRQKDNRYLIGGWFSSGKVFQLNQNYGFKLATQNKKKNKFHGLQ